MPVRGLEFPEGEARPPVFPDLDLVESRFGKPPNRERHHTAGASERVRASSRVADQSSCFVAYFHAHKLDAVASTALRRLDATRQGVPFGSLNGLART